MGKKYHEECENCYRATDPDPFEACGAYQDRPLNDEYGCPKREPRPTEEQQLQNIGIKALHG